jgi:ABC-type multidrug transport system ATPase subunit
VVAGTDPVGSASSRGLGSVAAIDIVDVSRRFGSHQALDGVSLEVREGEIHALLGPNGAGKTTLLRIVSGLVDPDGGELSLSGRPIGRLAPREHRRLLGLVPSGDRSFYLRISGIENLIFFGRLQGLSRAQATDRARACLEEVDLVEAARKRVGVYSHGMQKRLSVARALLMDPPVLLVDEATHDLDPEGAVRVRELVANAARRGASVIWATQRVDEIRGFVDRLTLLHRGTVRFRGTVPAFMAASRSTRHLVHLRSRAADESPDVLEPARAALRGSGSLTPTGETDGEHFVLDLETGSSLGVAITELTAAGVDVLSCREERSPIEDAFLAFTGTDEA